MTDFWKSALHRILCCYAQLLLPRTRNGLTLLIPDNLFEIHASDTAMSGNAPTISPEDVAEDPSSKNAE